MSDQHVIVDSQDAVDSAEDIAVSPDESQDTLEDDNASALATDKWEEMLATASGNVVEREISNENAYSGNVGIVSNGVANISNYYGTTGSIQRTYGSVRIAQDWLDKNRRVYVQQPSFSDALKMLGQRNVIILCSDQHTGKQSAALNLLAVKYPVAIHALHPQTDLDDTITFEPQHGYLLDSLHLTVADKISAFTLHQLADKLQPQQSYLAITVQSQSLLNQSGLDEYALLWNTTPERDLVLQKHLAWYLKDETLRPSAQAYCNYEPLKRVLAGLTPAQIDKLAKLLADIEFGRFSSVDQALARFTADPSTQVADWFRTYQLPEERAFLISLAVFSGARYQSIIDADKTLQALITDLPEPIASSAFDSTRTKILRDINARMFYTEEQAGFGPVLAERIELDKPEQRMAMLDHIWKEYDGLRAPILEWLRKMGLKTIPNMRELSAGAVARFAQYDLAEVRRAVLQHWARHYDNRVRRVAALALTLLAKDSRFSSYAFGLLTNWSLLRNSQRLSWTAAAAYGGLLDADYLEQSLEGLENIAQAGQASLVDVIVRGIANLFQAAQGQTMTCMKILDTLKAWTANVKSGKSTPIGLLAFVGLATPDSSEVIPALLPLSSTSECGEQIRTLWRRALNHPVARAKAVAALRTWLAAADIDATLFSTVQELITALVAAGDQREQERFDYWLDRWARDPRRPCRSAASIRLNVLSGTQAKEANA